MQHAAFSAAFLPGIPGGPASHSQSRWMLPVQTHGMHYPPRLLAVLLLIAHFRFLAPDDHSTRNEPDQKHKQLLSAVPPRTVRLSDRTRAAELKTETRAQKADKMIRVSSHLATQDATCTDIERNSTPGTRVEVQTGSLERAENEGEEEKPHAVVGMRVLAISGLSQGSQDGFLSSSAAVCEGLDRMWWNPASRVAPARQTLSEQPSRQSDIDRNRISTDITAASAVNPVVQDHSVQEAWAEPINELQVPEPARQGSTDPSIEDQQAVSDLSDQHPESFRHRATEAPPEDTPVYDFSFLEPSPHELSELSSVESLRQLVEVSQDLDVTRPKVVLCWQPTVRSSGRTTVLTAFLNARNRMMCELKLLQQAQRAPLLNAVEILATWLHRYSVDVVCSQHICSNARAVLAASNCNIKRSSSRSSWLPSGTHQRMIHEEGLLVANEAVSEDSKIHETPSCIAYLIAQAVMRSACMLRGLEALNGEEFDHIFSSAAAAAVASRSSSSSAGHSDVLGETTGMVKRSPRETKRRLQHIVSWRMVRTLQTYLKTTCSQPCS